MSGQIESKARRAGAKPRYRQIAEDLMGEISGGRIAVGELLPGELELSSRFGVSRHTVREALRLLEDDGVIGRRKGAGTTVLAARPREAFIQSVGSLAELLQYPSDTRLRIFRVDDVTVAGSLAQRLGVESGATWARLSGIREVGETLQPICWTDVYVVPEYAAVVERIGEPQPVYALIEAQFGEQVAHVDVQIQAQLLDAEVAERLGVSAASPALTVVRRYLGRGGRTFEVSVAQHPADQFSYRLSLSRDRLNSQESP